MNEGKRIVVLSALLMLMGCDTAQLSIGGLIVFYPASQEYQITEVQDENGLCIYYRDNFLDLPLQLTVQNRQGSNVGNVDVSVYADYTAANYSGPDVMALYADSNSNGVVDHPEELVSSDDDGAYRVRTSAYSGHSFLFVRLNLSCAYRGSVRAYGEGIYGQMEISVNSSSSNSGS